MQQGTTAWSRTTARTRHVSMHTFALRHPDLWERYRYLKKWTIDNWAKGYVRAEGPPGTKGNWRMDMATGEPGECGECHVLSDFFWDTERMVNDAPVMVCRIHRMLAPGWVYTVDPENSASTLLEEGVTHPVTHAHDKRTEVNGLALAEAVSSEDVKTGQHQLLIDIDRPCWLIPSTREDHFHLVVQMGTGGEGMTWPVYEKLLRALAAAGVIEEGYAEASIRRKATFLRLPWIRKGKESEDRQRALGWWIEQPEGVSLDGQSAEFPVPW